MIEGVRLTKIDGPDARAAAGVEHALQGLVLDRGAGEELVVLREHEEGVLEVWRVSVHAQKQVY